MHERFEQACRTGDNGGCAMRTKCSTRWVEAGLGARAGALRAELHGRPSPKAARSGIHVRQRRRRAAGKTRRPRLIGRLARWSAASCAYLGIMLSQGEGGPQDTAGARALYEQACTGGFARGCAYLGIMLSKGEGGPKDERRTGEPWLNQACEGGYAEGCRVGGRHVQNPSGHGGRADLPKGLPSGCQGLPTASCSNRRRWGARLGKRAGAYEQDSTAETLRLPYAWAHVRRGRRRAAGEGANARTLFEEA